MANFDSSTTLSVIYDPKEGTVKIGTDLIKLPKGKLLQILDKNNNQVIDRPLIVDSEFSLKTSSKYGTIWDAKPNNLMNLLSNSIYDATGFALPSGQMPLQGAQIWQSTDPIDFDFSIHLDMYSSGYKDVVEPAMKLVKCCLPKKADSMNVGSDTLGVNLKIKTLIPPGPNFQDIFNATETTVNGFNINNKDSSGVFTITVGDYITFSNVIITSVQPTFSSLMDDDGYPTSCDIDISMSTMEIATVDMIDSALLKSKGNA